MGTGLLVPVDDFSKDLTEMTLMQISIKDGSRVFARVAP